MAEWQRFYNIVDETLCDNVVCQHPLCWATFRRLERGLPRIRLQPVHKFLPEKQDKDDLPPLNILDLPQWSADKAIDVSSAPIISRKTAISVQSYKSAHPDILQSTSVLGTSLGSSMEFVRYTGSRSCSPPSRDRPVSVRKVEVIDLHQQPSTCDQYMGRTTYIWVPNPRNKRKWPKKHAKSFSHSSITPKSVSFKEISFQGQPFDQLDGLSVEQKQSQKMRKKAKTKAPTGGQPYTFLARKQQSLKRWKDTQKQLYKEHSNKLSEVAKGIVQQADHSDFVTEQGLIHQYSAAKSQPAYNRNGYQDARKIPANIMPIPVSKKVILHQFTEKQKQTRSPRNSRGLSRMEEQHLQCKYFGINHLKLQKCIDNNLSGFQDNIQTDQGSVHPPSPASSINDECVQRCSDLLGMKSISVHNVDGRQFTSLQMNLLMSLPGTSVYAQKSDYLTVSTAKVQSIKDLMASDITLTGFSAIELTAPEGQSDISGDTQQDLSSAIEVVAPTLEQAGSVDQSSVPVGGQDQLSAATEIGPPLEQARSEDEGGLPIAKPDDEQDLSAATEAASLTTERGDSEEQSNVPTVERDELPDQELAGTGMDEREDLGVIGETESPRVDQGEEDQRALQTAERNEQKDLGAAIKSIPLIREPGNGESHDDLQDDFTIAKSVEGQDSEAAV
ncbi:uncharacterized protein C9orf43 homolog isoform X1 [Amblyraja radiata]|uniref:uncharacterized protein C9orf43 homolog isoform X1 n=2 Tax=Amblyraja radiata TaxID=386614 RepID=UPI0014025E58|nr:uncharacterized protein C9orf43 homolog isoform X1 [Amblyraja radiata]XP_032904674.1 uncharacterized protein C9orf43 homolog isoform X1 [Amblyraja radiata]